MSRKNSRFNRTLNQIGNAVIRKEKVAMFHTGRCGSTVLGNMLNEHPGVCWAGEIFEGQKRVHVGTNESPERFAASTIKKSMQTAVSAVYGFETKYLPYQHLSASVVNMPLHDYVSMLSDLGFSRFVVLHRKNYLRRAISAMVGKQTNTWHSNRPASNPVKIYLELDKHPIGTRELPLIQSFQDMDAQFSHIQDVLSGQPLLVLHYEDDICESPLRGYEKVCDFVEIAPVATAPGLHRTNPFSCEEVVENFEAVKARLKNSPYEWMLYD